jgi:hypothetical protein
MLLRFYLFQQRLIEMTEDKTMCLGNLGIAEVVVIDKYPD